LLNALAGIFLPLVMITVLIDCGIELFSVPNIYPKLLAPRTKGNEIFTKPVQSPNALLPIDVTLLGIVTFVRLLQPWNALPPMLFTLSGIVTLFSPKHS